MDKLTIKQEGFVQDLRKGISQRQSYRNNYNCENMSDKTVDEAACRLLANSKVNARYHHLMDELRDKANEEGLLTATDVLRKIVELIDRNEIEDDKTALEGLKTYGKHLKLFTDKVEHTGSVDITQTSSLIDKYLEGGED